jgi:hypothetical protein
MMETQEFKNKIGQVAIILKMSVEFPSDEDMKWQRWAHLIKEYQKIRISIATEQKVHITGDFPTSIRGESGCYESKSSIYVSVTKSSEQIARDIERRFLPVYLPELEKAINQVKQSNDYHLKRRANIQKLADYFRVEFKEDNQEPSIYVYDLIKGLGPRIEAYGDDTVKFELEVTPKMAINIFDLMKAAEILLFYGIKEIGYLLKK